MLFSLPFKFCSRSDPFPANSALRVPPPAPWAARILAVRFLGVCVHLQPREGASLPNAAARWGSRWCPCAGRAGARAGGAGARALGEQVPELGEQVPARWGSRCPRWGSRCTRWGSRCACSARVLPTPCARAATIAMPGQAPGRVCEWGTFPGPRRLPGHRLLVSGYLRRLRSPPSTHSRVLFSAFAHGMAGDAPDRVHAQEDNGNVLFACCSRRCLAMRSPVNKERSVGLLRCPHHGFDGS